MREFKDSGFAQSGMPAGDALASAMLREAEAWTRMQSELFGSMETLWADWLRRRCEAMQATSRTVQRICESRTLGDVARAQQDWVVGAIERTTADMSSWAGGAATATRKITDTAVAASPVAAIQQFQREAAERQPERAAAE